MRVPRVALVSVVALGLVAGVTTVGSAATEPRTRCPTDGDPVRDVRYRRVPKGVDPDRLSLDVYPVTTGCPAPVVVWVHGGGWQVGDKANQIRDKVRWLHDLGYAVVSVNYRLTDPDDRDPVRYPTHAADVAAALAWVHQHIGRSGGDPDRVAVLGHSAGAQLVAAVATDPALLGARDLTPSDLACVAPLDTEGFDVARMGARGIPLYLAAFGTDPAVWAEASPLTHVAPHTGIPPHLVVARGAAPRRRVLDRYVTALRDAGVPVTVVDGTGLSHADVNRRIGTAGDDVMTPALAAFLAGCFGAAPT